MIDIEEKEILNNLSEYLKQCIAEFGESMFTDYLKALEQLQAENKRLKDVLRKIQHVSKRGENKTYLKNELIESLNLINKFTNIFVALPKPPEGKQ